jgi:hypothetical protein
MLDLSVHFGRVKKGGRGVKDRHPTLKNLSGRGKSVDAKGVDICPAVLAFM